MFLMQKCGSCLDTVMGDAGVKHDKQVVPSPLQQSVLDNFAPEAMEEWVQADIKNRGEEDELVKNYTASSTEFSNNETFKAFSK